MIEPIRIAAAVAIVVAAASSPDASFAQAGNARAQHIVALFDSARGTAGASETVVRIQSGEGGANSRRFRVLDDGKQASLVEFLDPLQRGTKVLATGGDLWFFTPRTRRAIRIPPLQRLIGEASYGDIARLKLSTDYAASGAPIATANGAALRVDLNARSPAATYGRVRLIVRAKDMVPLRAMYFVASGKHLRTVEFIGATRSGNRITNDHWRIFAPEAPDRHTDIHVEQAQSRAIPTSTFSRRALEEG